MKLQLLATAVLALGVGSAAAQDAGYDWSGVYVGGQLGYVRANGHFFGTAPFADNSYPKSNGVSGGLYAGANYQFGNNVVAGIEADFAWSGANDRAPVYDPTGTPWPAFFQIVQKINRTGAVRGRLGYDINRWLPYVAGGVAFANVSQRLTGAAEDWSTTYTGWTLGGGVEYAFTRNVIFRSEYRYSDFGTKTFEAFLAPPINISLKTHDVRFGVAYKF